MPRFFTDSGAAFYELCTGACEEPIVDSIGVFEYETNQIARIFIWKAAENVDTDAIVEESPKSDRGNNRGQAVSKARMNYGYTDFNSRDRKGSKNGLLTGHL